MADVKLIKNLREITQAGFLDCKKALEENNDNLEAAIKYLREKGIAKANKKVGAIAAEGVILVSLNNQGAVICEINSQTDFAAKNQNFIDLSNEICCALLNNNCSDLSSAQALKLSNGETINDACNALTGKIGEKITLRRFKKYPIAENKLGIYQHANKKYGSIVVFDNECNDRTLAKNIAMHIVAMNPKFIDRTQVDNTWLENEKKIVTQQVIDSGKPKEFADKIVIGKINKTLAEICLVDQEFDFEPGKKVCDVLKQHNLKIIDFIRFEVGEGIEKKESNFAQEVADQMRV